MNISEKQNVEWQDIFKEIKSSDMPDAQKVAQAFGWITNRMIEAGESRIELLQAMQDQEELVKEHIKLGMIKHVRGTLGWCYKFMIGEEAWYDE